MDKRAEKGDLQGKTGGKKKEQEKKRKKKRLFSLENVTLRGNVMTDFNSILLRNWNQLFSMSMGITARNNGMWKL